MLRKNAMILALAVLLAFSGCTVNQAPTETGATIQAGEELEKQDTPKPSVGGILSSEKFTRICDWETLNAQDREILSAAQQYDRAFFRDHDLLLIWLGEGSGPALHLVQKTDYTDGFLSVWVYKQFSPTMTLDLVRRFVLVPLEKELEVTDIQVHTGIETDSQAEFREPPKLEIVHDSGKFEALKGTFTWSHATGDGTWATVCADAMHPLQMKKHLKLVQCGSNQVRLSFEDSPDTVTVRCWPQRKFGNTNAESEAATLWNRVLELNMGGWIYEVTATWEDDGGNFHGTATYVFYMAPAILHIQPYSQKVGNSVTTVHLAGESFSFRGEKSDAVNGILASLVFDSEKMCRCPGEYTLDTRLGENFVINLSHGFVRCEKGQADLEKEQVETLRAILEWVEKETRAR